MCKVQVRIQPRRSKYKATHTQTNRMHRCTGCGRQNRQVLQRDEPNTVRKPEIGVSRGSGAGNSIAQDGTKLHSNSKGIDHSQEG